MRVHLTFDVEIWCNGWRDLDARFAASFDRYVYGRSAHGDYALPKTVEILQQHGLQGIFFIEPLFSARFGARFLTEVVGLIAGGGQDVQLHLHPEWTDEIEPPPISDVSRKRQHLCQYTLDEQTQLIAFGKAALEAATGAPLRAFRAGSYAANRDTYTALERNGILIDSSLNEVHAISGADLRERADAFDCSRQIGAVTSYPVTVFRDGFGRLRPAQVGACSFEELRDALDTAAVAGCEHFVIVSHNFEMLRQDSALPDGVVAARFRRLCRHLADNGDRFDVGAFAAPLQHDAQRAGKRARAGALSTGRRHVEQLWRRVV